MIHRKQAVVLWLLVGLITLASCARASTPPPAADQRYQTPIPEATIQAYSFAAPIADQLQAVIAARAFLNGTRLESLQPPEVLLAERVTLAEARKRTERPGTSSAQDLAPDTPVWLVIFKGTWQVHPPDPERTITPPPPVQACQYVWMAEDRDGYGATGTIDCPGERGAINE